MSGAPGPAALAAVVDVLEAIELGQFRLHYQAIFSLTARPSSPVAFEALARWAHPDHGLLLPQRFLPDPLDDELGWALTNFALEESVRQCARWQRAGLDASVAVNIAPGALAEEILPDQVGAVLERYCLPPHRLTVEITENRCALDPIGMAQALAKLSVLGVRVSLDDFGTGDSSLARLREIHFDELKIDRSFVRELPSGDTDVAIVEMVTDLAHRLGSIVVAEGIESDGALRTLRALSVDRGQGFLLGRPAGIIDLT
jgi:EAL domain-containing protein (putative c-di-GMP-specific phosphodiesterase class I)